MNSCCFLFCVTSLSDIKLMSTKATADPALPALLKLECLLGSRATEDANSCILLQQELKEKEHPSKGLSHCLK